MQGDTPLVDDDKKPNGNQLDLSSPGVMLE